MLGLGYVILCMLVAIFAYPLASDNTPNANYQSLELRKLPPGTEADLLLLPGIQSDEERGFFTVLFGGEARAERPVPMKPGTEIQIKDGRVYYTHWSGSEESVSLTEWGEAAEKSSWKPPVRHLSFSLGSDAYGRDLLSRIMLGARVSISIGLLAVIMSLMIGVTMGLIAGYFGGWVDRFVMWMVSVSWAIPTLLMAVAISFVFGKGFWQLFVAIGFSMWVESARIVRGEVLSVGKLEFTEAARALGYKSPRILFKHILPNIVSPIIVVAVANFGTAVLIESGLSFLGMGVEPPMPSWGRMVYEGYTYIMFEGSQYLAFYPGLALILLVISVNLIGIGLRDTLDVKM